MAWKIVETNDKTLKTFVGQALVQKIDQKQQALTKPDEVINYVLDNSSGWYQQRRKTNEMDRFRFCIFFPFMVVVKLFCT